MRTLLLALLVLGSVPGAAKAPAPPRLLSQTGLYAAPGVVAARNLAYAPQYPLWTDGAAKRRWIRLPAGATIDAADPDNSMTFPKTAPRRNTAKYFCTNSAVAAMKTWE